MFFSCFLVMTGCLGFAVIVGAGICGLGEAIGISRPVLIVLLALIGAPTVIVLVGVFLLSLFHTWLACTGRTTREVLSMRRANTSGQTLFAIRGPSLLHARDRVSCQLPCTT
eukprot:NODE_18614_length_884_cov_6.206077.p1 GENE.NODE_18614_length_884_cov_6.206077~~NODE_18614_length_884_cov_6.206077.p1  ORF type:complete len:112 (-),score=22.72 NODE_18614_length_884_cov_6.206077:319-654(-)